MRTGIGWLRLDLDFRKNWYDKVFICLILVSLVLRAVWLDRPLDFLIFDEQYYVNVARNILVFLTRVYMRILQAGSTRTLSTLH